jgi:hypothetical protein
VGFNLRIDRALGWLCLFLVGAIGWSAERFTRTSARPRHGGPAEAGHHGV